MCTQKIRREARKQRRSRRRVCPTQPAMQPAMQPATQSAMQPAMQPVSFSTEETIECQGCHEEFPLLSKEGEPGIQIHCAGCDKFFHCHIAGTCYGSHCTHKTSIGVTHRLSWCIHCVPMYAMNCEKQKRDEKCICHICIRDI